LRSTLCGTTDIGLRLAEVDSGQSRTTNGGGLNLQDWTMTDDMTVKVPGKGKPTLLGY